MGSGSPRLADWNLAGEVGRRLAGTGVAVAPADRACLREDISELVALSQSLVAETTGLPAPRLRARAWVMSRGEWISANLRSLQRLLEPLAERIVPGNRGELRRKALGAQMGALLGYVSRKVLGQYDLFLPPDDEGLMYFVGPNIAGAEQKFALPARDFRLWISLHEITHRAQFASAPWLRAHLTGLVDTYFSSIQMDPKELMNQLRRAVQEARD